MGLNVLIGAARSGKSTFSRKWLKEISNTNRVVVNSDTIRLALHGKRYYRDAEPHVHAQTYLMVKVLHLDGYEVLVDETSTSEGSIRRWLEIDKTAQFIWTNTPIQVCLQRAHDTNQIDLNPVIKRHFDNIENLSNYCKTPSFYNRYEKLNNSIQMIRNEIDDCPIIPLIEIKYEANS